MTKCSKLAQKEYKTKYDCVGKMIDWKLCKRLEFDHTTKWYQQRSEYDQTNEMHNLFEILR